MNRIECPHCNKPTISWWRKQFLGPARSISCPECDAKLSVARKSLVPAVIGMMLVVYSANKVGLIFLLLLPVIGIYHQFFVPLEVRVRPMNERLAELVGSESAEK